MCVIPDHYTCLQEIFMWKETESDLKQCQRIQVSASQALKTETFKNHDIISYYDYVCYIFISLSFSTTAGVREKNKNIITGQK